MDESSTIMSCAVAMTAKARPRRLGAAVVATPPAVPVVPAATAVPGMVPVSDEVADKIIPLISGIVIQRRDQVGPASWVKLG
jgi:hypothetical protein